MQAIKEKLKPLVNKKSSIRYDELERYLQVCDLKHEGKTTKRITEIMAPNYTGDQVNIMRCVQRDLAKAKQIIKNTETGIFPGKY